ncbi:MAG: ApaG domain [Verrucomicrobiales bacterium]|nr:ApaG domain [Verrucomicrobiales bacterium]
MSQSSKPVEVPGLNVTLDRLVYRHAPEISPDRPHCFVYFLTIHNRSAQAVTIKGRKWVVSHDDGSTLVVEGDGVVGKTPTIPPGDEFSYNSQHLTDTRHAVAEGSYLGLDSDGRKVLIRIPRFELAVPATE